MILAQNGNGAHLPTTDTLPNGKPKSNALFPCWSSRVAFFRIVPRSSRNVHHIDIFSFQTTKDSPQELTSKAVNSDMPSSNANKVSLFRSERIPLKWSGGCGTPRHNHVVHLHMENVWRHFSFKALSLSVHTQVSLCNLPLVTGYFKIEIVASDSWLVVKFCSWVSDKLE